MECSKLITFKTGNLFNQNCDAIVNTVNTVGVMGKGVAAQCKIKFPENFHSYKDACDNKKLRPGEILVNKENGVEIINLATKDHWKDPSKYEWIEAGVINLKQYLQATNIKSIAIPPIGCGNGKLDWNIVKNIIQKHLVNIQNKDIIVLEPENIMPSNTKPKIYKWKRCSCCIEKGKFNIDNIPLDCSATWDLVCSGYTIGIFQLETRLGQDWSRKVQPRNINELSDLISLLRPSCLESGMADDYVERKRGNKPITYLHESLSHILNNTFGVSVYQEQNIRIAKDIAGFSLQQADALRKGIGKKLPEVISKCRKDFIEGCKKTKIVDDAIAEKIFDFIEKAQRYQFNKSHAISYAMLGYQTAYIKCHFPVEFYISYLNHAKHKSDPKEEIYNLVQDARFFDIEILPPDISQGNLDFCQDSKHHNRILFGLSHILGIGDAAINKLKKIENWIDFIKQVPYLHKNIAEALIRSGSCDLFKIPRIRMIKEIECLFGSKDRDDKGKVLTKKGLTKKEIGIFFQKLDETKDIIKSLEYLTLPDTKGIIKRRKDVILSLIQELNNDCKDTNTAKATAEKHYLGISLSCSPSDDFNTEDHTHSCLDFAKGLNGVKVNICCVIDTVRHTKTKKGNNPGQPMAILKISDSTYSLDSVLVFPDAYMKLKSMCKENLIISISGYKKNGIFVVEDMLRLI